MASRIIHTEAEATLAESQGFNVPAHSEEDFPFMVHGNRADGEAKPRTFIVKVTEQKITKYRLTLDEAMTLFPHVRWSEEDVSHAGEMEEETMVNASLPPGFRDLDVDDHDEDIDWRIWEE